ncbi:hypothetical protein HY992_04610 [Candidatus Micrarchaeota archaeon]|nr:hypothetical protein [Candidatus Micrarchaeota archaeon]
MKKICPKCGADSEERKFAGSFCEDCASGKASIQTPAKIEFKECKMCGRIWLREWTQKTTKALEEYIISKCKGEHANAHAKITSENAEVTFIVKKNDSLLETTRNIPIEFENTMCLDCSRESGGYFEAIIQIRGSKENAERTLKKIERQLTRNTFIAKTKESKGGYDMYAGNSKAAGEALNSLELSPTKAYKLFGVKEGKKIYRTTYCVRV